MQRKSRIALTAALATLTAGVFAGPAAGRAQDIPSLPWTELLPPLPSSTNPQPHPVAHCKVAKRKCVTGVVHRLRRLRDRLGCDHRAVFASTYLELTKQIRRDIRRGIVKRTFISPRYLYLEDALFANVYLRTVRAYNRGRPVADAWRIAFETAARDDTGGVQDMLLGINAHVQNDMPFVLASLGLRTRNGLSRKPDHDAGNGSLARGYERVVAAARTRYDASFDLTNSELVPFDNAVGLELTKGWREMVWRNAERLVNAKTAAERRQVAQSIEDYAAASANLIAAGGIPGYGATRDAYCAAGPAG